MILLAILAVLATPAAIASAQGFVPKPAPDPTTTTESSSGIAGDTPVLPAPTPPAAPVIVPAPGIGTQTLLIKRVRSQLVRYTKSTHRWQNLLGQRPMRPVNIWALGSLQRATRLLAAWKTRSHHLHRAARKLMRQRIQFYREDADHMRTVMGIGRGRVLQSSGNLELQYARTRRVWRSVHQRFMNPPYESQLMCIHGGEGSWTDPNYPFWGGLQMDMSFQATYGGHLLRTKGTADHWTPLEQMWVAAKAVRSGRGFYPWPNTARACGLI